MRAGRVFGAGGYWARSAVASGMRAARTAGNSAPSRPTPPAHANPVSKVAGVIASVVINVLDPPPMLIESPENSSHAIALPAAAPIKASASASATTEAA